VDIKTWQRPKTEATKRMDKLVLFVSKHRAHLSMSRFVPEYQDLEDLIGVQSLTAEYLGRMLLDFLDVLGEFIAHLPDTKECGKGFWQGAAYSSRYKTEVTLGIRESDHPDYFNQGWWKRSRSFVERPESARTTVRGPYGPDPILHLCIMMQGCRMGSCGPRSNSPTTCIGRQCQSPGTRRAVSVRQSPNSCAVVSAKVRPRASPAAR